MKTKAIHRVIILLFLALSFVACGASTGRVEQFDFTNKHFYLGGPSYRVFDVVEITSSSEIPVDGFDDSTYEIPPLDILFQFAQECTETTGDFDLVRVFSTSKIDVKDEETGKWNHVGIIGVWGRNTPWVYFTTGRSSYSTARTIVHEYLHYLTKLGHPEADDLVRVCNDYLYNQS